jgi:hypothetical protein
MLEQNINGHSNDSTELGNQNFWQRNFPRRALFLLFIFLTLSMLAPAVANLAFESISVITPVLKAEKGPTPVPTFFLLLFAGCLFGGALYFLFLLWIIKNIYKSAVSDFKVRLLLLSFCLMWVFIVFCVL